VLPPGDRRRAEAINVLPPGAEAEGMLLLGRMPQRSTATGGTSQGGSHCATIGGGSRRSATIGAHAIKEYCHRGNVVGRKPLYYYRGRK